MWKFHTNLAQVQSNKFKFLHSKVTLQKKLHLENQEIFHSSGKDIHWSCQGRGTSISNTSVPESWNHTVLTVSMHWENTFEYMFWKYLLPQPWLQLSIVVSHTSYWIVITAMSTLPILFAESPIRCQVIAARVNLCATPCSFRVTCAAGPNGIRIGKAEFVQLCCKSVANCVGRNSVGPPCVCALIVGDTVGGAGENAQLVVFCHTSFVWNKIKYLYALPWWWKHDGIGMLAAQGPR